MKITEIRGYHLCCTLAEPIGNAVTVFDSKEALLVEVVTDAGLVGWGEAWSSPITAAAYIRHRLAPLLLGQDPTATGRLWRIMAGTAGYDRRGSAMMATAAIDIALHDITGKARAVPVSALLGGALRDRAMAYASGPFMRPGGHPYRTFASQVEAWAREGFRAFKPRGGCSPHEDGAMMLGLRRQLGPDAALMLDFNQGYTASAAIQAARHLQEAELLWLEEPVGPEDVTGYRAVAQSAPMAIAGGEALASLAGFRDFVTAGAMGVLQPDLAVCGGFTGVMRVAALAEAFDLPVVPHVWGAVVNYHAALQLVAVLPACHAGSVASLPFIEVDVTENPLLELVGKPRPDAAGMIAIPDRPGLGLDLSADQLAPWVIDRWNVRV